MGSFSEWWESGKVKPEPCDLYDATGLFKSYMEMLRDVIYQDVIKCHQYADDTQFYILILAWPRNAVDVLSQSLKAVGFWMKGNRLKLNPNKSK